MSPTARRLVGQMIVLLPTVAVSAFLGHRGVALLPRFVASIGVGMVLIAAVAKWQRRQG